MVMPWLFGILVTLAVAAVVSVLVIDRRSSRRPDSAPRKRLVLPWRRLESQQYLDLPRRLANSASLFQLPAVHSRIRAQRRLHALLAVLLAVCLLSASAIAGRPVRVTERSDALANRDIVLCLDVSTSMVKIDSSVLTTFADILEDFDGERVGLVAWNSAAQTIVPLTDDYDLLRQQMDDLGDVLDIDPQNPTYKQQLRYLEAFSGTQNTSLDGSSLAGDGLASCAQAFDTRGWSAPAPSSSPPTIRSSTPRRSRSTPSPTPSTSWRSARSACSPSTVPTTISPPSTSSTRAPRTPARSSRPSPRGRARAASTTSRTRAPAAISSRSWRRLRSTRSEAASRPVAPTSPRRSSSPSRSCFWAIWD